MTLKEVNKLNKSQLIEYAESIGIEVKEDMSKAIILDMVKNSGKLEENPTDTNPADGSATDKELEAPETTADETQSEVVPEAPADETPAEGATEAVVPTGKIDTPPTEADIQAKVEEVNSIRLAMALELSKRQSKISTGITKCLNIGNALGAELARRASKYGSVSKIPASPEEISNALDQELARRQAKNK